MSEINDFKKRLETYKAEFEKARGFSESSYTDIMYDALLGSYNDYVSMREKEHLEK